MLERSYIAGHIALEPAMSWPLLLGIPDEPDKLVDRQDFLARQHIDSGSVRLAGQHYQPLH